MKFIWATSRMKYIMTPKNKRGCVFCESLSKVDGPENLIISRTPKAFVMVNRYPYTTGHIMVVPIEHKASLEDFSTECRIELIELTSISISIIRQVYAPEGINVGINIGEAAGAGLAAHLHIHIVPRWNGDTNFMSTLADTRVLPEALEDTWRRIREGFKS